MKVVLKSLLLVSLVITMFSCKDKVIEKPDSLTPIQMTLEELIKDWSKYENQTVMLDSVYFNHPAGTKFNDCGSNSCGGKDLVDCNGNTMEVFTYSSDDWALKEVPTKMGKFYAAVSQYNGSPQLRMRSYDDVKEMTLDKCAEYAEVITIPQFLTGAYNGKLVKILDVQFDEPAGTKFNGTASNGGGSKDLVDCDGNSTIVFTYTDDPWTNDEVPQGNGYIIATASEYMGTQQLLMRSIDDVAAMTGARCSTTPACTAPNTCATGYFCDDFEGGSLTAKNCWTVQEVSNPNGVASWVLGTIGGNYAKASNWDGTDNNLADWWLISPAINLSSSTAPKLSFDNVTRYTGDVMKVLISTNYDGTSAPSSATWTDITSLFTLDTDNGSWTLVPAGTGDITAYKSATTYIAFQYTGSSSNGSTWEVDNILIAE